MDIHHLVRMANDIGNFFQVEPDRATAVHGMADHIRRSWEPRMRRAIITHHRQGGEGMSELARLAIGQLDGETLSLHETTGDG